MVRFTCRCKHVLEVPDDYAGRQVQCPNCHHLLDVPTKSDLLELASDGTFRIDETPDQPHPEHFESMRRVFAKDKVDFDGVEFDLRQTPEELAAAGTHDDINEFDNHPTAPKYDPETGELVRPLDIAPDIETAKHASQFPMASTTLNYANPALTPSTSVFAPLTQLLAPVNLAAMFFILVGHIFFFLAAFSLFLSVASIFVVGPGLVAHYANVIEEVGVEERDELPRFLRNFSIADDVWHPFIHVFLAWMICFGAAKIVWVVYALKNWPFSSGLTITSILDFAGAIFFPAVVLTTTTSGSIQNLRPDRILKVMVLIGPRYIFLVILYIVAIALYTFGLVTTPIHALLFASMVKHLPWYYTALSAYSFLIGGIYLMHYFAWLLGLSYRTNRTKFPWLYHQYVRSIPGVNAPRYARPTRGFPRPNAPPGASKLPK